MPTLVWVRVIGEAGASGASTGGDFVGDVCVKSGNFTPLY